MTVETTHTVEAPASPDTAFTLGVHEGRLAAIEEKLGIHAAAIGETMEQVEQVQDRADTAVDIALDAVIAQPSVDLDEVAEVAAEVAEAVAEEVAAEVIEEIPTATQDGVTEVAEETPPPPPEGEGDKPIVEDTPAPHKRPKPYGRRNR